MGTDVGLWVDIVEFRSGKASDVISTLVSIYETREGIFKELQVLLASRLFSVKNYDAVKEVCVLPPYPHPPALLFGVGYGKFGFDELMRCFCI
jgi:hypothetical protein